MEDLATKRARLAVGTVCDACGKQFPHPMDTTSNREADICAALLATSEMMDQIDTKWWPQQEPTCLQHCCRSLGCQKLEKAAVQCMEYKFYITYET